jgi:hypothetical protein
VARGSCVGCSTPSGADVAVHRGDHLVGQRADGMPRSSARLMILSSMSVMLRT